MVVVFFARQFFFAMDLVPKPHGVTRWVCLKTVGAVLAPLKKLENDSILVGKFRAHIVLLLMEEIPNV